MKKIKLALLLALLISNQVFADNTGWVDLTEVFTGTDSARVNLKISTTIPNPANCTGIDYLQADDDSVNREQILSIALMALAADREVWIEIATGGCSQGDRPRVRGIRVR